MDLAELLSHPVFAALAAVLFLPLLFRLLGGRRRLRPVALQAGLKARSVRGGLGVGTHSRAPAG